MGDVNFFIEMFWPDGLECPDCKAPNPYGTAAGYKCRKCERDFTIRTGNYMEGSPLDIKVWRTAIELLETGVSVTELSKLLNVTYKTAWEIQHSIITHEKHVRRLREDAPRFWVDAKPMPAWIIYLGYPAREMLFVKNKGKGKKARYWTHKNGGGWLYKYEKHKDWFLTLEECEAKVYVNRLTEAEEKEARVIRGQEAIGRKRVRALARLSPNELPVESIPFDLSMAAYQLLQNERETRK